MVYMLQIIFMNYIWKWKLINAYSSREQQQVKGENNSSLPKLHFTSTLLVTSLESNTFSMSASFADRAGVDPREYAWLEDRHDCDANTKQACLLHDITTKVDEIRFIQYLYLIIYMQFDLM